MKPGLFILLFIISIYSDAQEKIPLRYERHIYFDAVVGGSHSASLIFDTGADYLYLDTLFFQNDNIECSNLAKGNAPGIGEGVQKVDICVDPFEFRIGNQELTSKITPLIDLKNLIGKKADGLFGTSFINDKVLIFNLQDQYMQVSDPEALETEGFEKIPAVIRRNRVFIKATAVLTSGKEISGEYLLDMGAPMTVYFSGKTTKAYSLKSLQVPMKEHYTNRGGIGGKSSGANFRIKSLNVGNQTIELPIANCSYDQEGALGSSTSYVGLIGNKFYENFILMIDFPNTCIYLKPVGSQDRDEFYKAGYTWIDRTDINKGWIVKRMYRQSPAENAGLKLEDMISHINGLDVTKLSFQKGNKILNNPNEPVNLSVLRNGEKLSIKYKPGLD